MAIYYSLGSALVTREELFEKTDELKKFRSKVSLKKPAGIKFTTGKLNELHVSKATTVSKTKFVPVGINKPLTIELRHLYTGAHPKTFLGKKKDMLVSTALKGFVSYDAAPRAINYLKQNIQPNTNIKPSASEQGTPLVFYSPGVTQPATLLTVEVIFDNFPKEVFNKISSAFNTAASIPVFASASFYLLAAGMVTKLLGRAGESIFDGDVAVKFDDELSFERPGSEVPVADFRLMTLNNFDQGILTTHSVGKNGVLLDKNGNAYAGEHPYATLSLDGRENKEYDNFVPTAISAALLERFYNVKEGKEQSLDILMEALSLYNDVKYRSEADKVTKALSKLDPKSADYTKLKEKYDALVKNIGKDLLRPGEIS